MGFYCTICTMWDLSLVLSLLCMSVSLWPHTASSCPCADLLRPLCMSEPRPCTMRHEHSTSLYHVVGQHLHGGREGRGPGPGPGAAVLGLGRVPEIDQIVVSIQNVRTLVPGPWTLVAEWLVRTEDLLAATRTR